ncbi:hypothetical protein Hanom_Chr09g00759501 [Helianthus anomalus]
MDPTKFLKSIARVFHMLKLHIRSDEVEMQQFVFTPVYTSCGGMMVMVLVV